MHNTSKYPVYFYTCYKRGMHLTDIRFLNI